MIQYYFYEKRRFAYLFGLFKAFFGGLDVDTLEAGTKRISSLK